MTARHARWAFPVALFVAFGGLLLTWVIGTPLFAVPDEPAHWYKAYGTAHGEAIGSAYPGLPDNVRLFDAPAEMGVPDLQCYFGKPDVSAACADHVAGPAISTAALVPPIWYAVVGGSARVIGAETSQRAYRAIGAAIVAALLAAAFAVVRNSAYRRWSPMLLLGITPMALSLAAGVNPNGFEIAAFATIWALATRIRPDARATWQAGVAVGALAGTAILSRFAASIWLCTTVAVVAIAFGFVEVRRVASRAFLAPCLGLLTLSGAALVAWSEYVGFEVRDAAAASDWTRWHVITYTVGALPDITQQMIGVLGWLDTDLPVVVYVAAFVASAISVAGVALSRNRRLITATFALVGLLVTVPVVVNTVTAPTAGLVWQGRYSLSLFVGLGVLGAMGWGSALRPAPSAMVVRGVRLAVVVCFAIAEFAGFWEMLRRFTVGAQGRWWLTGPLPWRPEVAPMALVAGNLAFVVAIATVLLVGTGGTTTTLAADDPFGPSGGDSLPSAGSAE